MCSVQHKLEMEHLNGPSISLLFQIQSFTSRNPDLPRCSYTPNFTKLRSPDTSLEMAFVVEPKRLHESNGRAPVFWTREHLVASLRERRLKRLQAEEEKKQEEAKALSAACEFVSWLLLKVLMSN